MPPRVLQREARATGFCKLVFNSPVSEWEPVPAQEMTPHRGCRWTRWPLLTEAKRADPGACRRGVLPTHGSQQARKSSDTQGASSQRLGTHVFPWLSRSYKPLVPSHTLRSILRGAEAAATGETKQFYSRTLRGLPNHWMGLHIKPGRAQSFNLSY